MRIRREKRDRMNSAIPVRSLTNIERQSRLEPRMFCDRDVCSYNTDCSAPLTELRDRDHNITALASVFIT